MKNLIVALLILFAVILMISLKKRRNKKIGTQRKYFAESDVIIPPPAFPHKKLTCQTSDGTRVYDDYSVSDVVELSDGRCEDFPYRDRALLDMLNSCLMDNSLYDLIWQKPIPDDSIHSFSHMNRVERNAILLSLEMKDGMPYLRDDINIRVVRRFAYLHDRCRYNDGKDIEHGARAAEMVLTMRETYLSDLTDDEINLLERACRLHTVEHRTGNLTIDTCFDADRLDLGRCGIKPDPDKMATERGRYFAANPLEYSKRMRLMHWDRSKKSEI